MTKRSYHDMGGLPGGPVDNHEHTPTLSERRVDAMMLVLRNKPHSFWTTDEHRRTLESLTPEMYEGGGYYGRWARGIKGLLVEKGVLTESEVAAKLAEVKARHGKAGTGSGG
jgi:nitrile hydratase subunit beta